MFVYKGYDQAALDRQYNNRLHVPDFADHLNKWESLSRETEKTLKVVKDIPYGSLPGERLDVFPASQPFSRTLIFIHGGYWQMFDKAMFHFIARGFHAYGITVVLLGYPLAPGASMNQMVQSCRNAVQWLYTHVAAFNGDPHQMYVAGHSAGGHLAAMLMATNWSQMNPATPANVLKGACFISGVFDLVPIRLSYLNKILKLDEDAAMRNSPVRLEPATPAPLIAAVGAAETAAFNDQSRDLWADWKDKVPDFSFLQISRLNHFSIVATMIDPGAVLHKGICRLMKIDLHRSK